MLRWLQQPPPRGVLGGLLVAGLVACFFLEKFELIGTYPRFVLISLGINIILCVSLNLVNGWMGEFSVGHAGFMALGAYLSACVTQKWLAACDAAWMFPAAVLAGGLLAGAVGFLLGMLSFKTRGDYLAIITLAFLMIVKSGIENIPYVGGPRGFLGIRNYTTLTWTAAWTIAALWAIRNLVYSRYGRGIVAVREDEIAANAMGVDTRKAKLTAFAVSSFFGGVAGALFAHQLQFINPGSFDIVKSTEILVMVYLGGIGSIAGSILGAVAFTFLGQALQPLGTWRMVVLPLVLVLLMLFRPRGIMGLREFAWFVPRREFEKKGGDK